MWRLFANVYATVQILEINIFNEAPNHNNKKGLISAIIDAYSLNVCDLCMLYCDYPSDTPDLVLVVLQS